MTQILIPIPKSPLIDPRTLQPTREWYRYFSLLQGAVGGSTTIIDQIDISQPGGEDASSLEAGSEAAQAHSMASADAGLIEDLRRRVEGLDRQVPGPSDQSDIFAPLGPLTPFAMPPTELGALQVAQNLAYRIVDAGHADLVAGTVTVNSIQAASAREFLLTAKVVAGTQGILSVGTVIANTSFVINSSNAADTSTVSWAILKAIA